MLSPLYGQLSPLRVPTKSGRSTASDADAEAYLLAVEAADLQPIEDAVAVAINNFVVGCKADGIWSALKASCILAGARTLPGALVPLVGSAPTNNNFVSANYNRKTGLIGDGTSKNLISNRNNNADPQNSKHVSVFATETSSVTGANYIGGSVAAGTTQILISSATQINHRLHTTSNAILLTNFAGLIGTSRSNSTQIIGRGNRTSTTLSSTSSGPQNQILRVFSNGNGAAEVAARLSFYSIGESLDLAALDTRVSNLMTAINAAIP
jgi:hypothetical protein